MPPEANMAGHQYDSDASSTDGSSSSVSVSSYSSSLSSQSNIDAGRERRFDRLLRGSGGGGGSARPVSRRELRSLCWSGVPDAHRAEAWRLLLEYVPSDPSRRGRTLRRRRDEYKSVAERCYGRPDPHYSASLSRQLPESADPTVLRQVRKDVPRTVPDLALFRERRVQARLERVLYVWAHRNPAAGYVQGMNDVAAPFFIAFLKGAYRNKEEYSSTMFSSRATEDSDVPDSVLDDVEADVYWCLSRLLSGMQDHYTPSQPGIRRMINQLEDVLAAVDPALSDHLRRSGVEVLHFAFRWMNCLLVRELPLNCVLRLFDSYLSEEDAAGRDELHVYVCAALLSRLSPRLLTLDHDVLLESLTNSAHGRLDLEEISASDVDIMLGQAHVWRTAFGGSRARIECARSEQLKRTSAVAGAGAGAQQAGRRLSSKASSCSLEGQRRAEEEDESVTTSTNVTERTLSELTGVGVSDVDYLCY